MNFGISGGRESTAERALPDWRWEALSNVNNALLDCADDDLTDPQVKVPWWHPSAGSE